MTASQDALRPEEFAEAARAAVDDARTRPLRDAARVLARAGLSGVGAAEADGGLGLDIAFALPIAEAAGREQLRFPIVEQMLLARALAGTPAAAALAAGDALGSIAWQGSIAEGVAGHARHAADVDWVLVAQDGADAAVDDGDSGAVLLEVAGLGVQADGALDPEVPCVWLSLEGAREVARIDAARLARLRDEARILYAGFVTGAAEGAIRRTANHVATRVQFGRPLSAKQAVRHWLARMQLLAEVSAAASRRALDADEFGAARDTRATLAGALANATFVIEKAIHLHGGMGFTWEMPLHHSLRDIRAVDAAFGGGGLAHAIGRRFIDAVDAARQARAA
ncbi:MAG: acyl-CoA dehydrogenase family protein [Lautropia sp.]